MFKPKKILTRRKDAENNGIIIEPEDIKIEIFKDNLYFNVNPIIFYHDETTCNISIAGNVFIYLKFDEFSKPGIETKIQNVEFNLLNPKNYNLPENFKKNIANYAADFLTYKKYYYYSYSEDVINLRKLLLKNKQQFLKILNC